MPLESCREEASGRGSSRGAPTLVVAALAALAVAAASVRVGPALADPAPSGARTASEGAEPVQTPAPLLTAPPSDAREILFPVPAVTWHRDDYGAPRDGGARRHEGNDLFAEKHEPVVAVADGVVVALGHTNAGRAGNYLILEDGDGWRYSYVHLNNDTPGTDDGANLYELAFAPGVRKGAWVRAGDILGYVGDSGNAEDVAPHLHFQVRNPDGETIDPHASLAAARLPEDHFHYLCRGFDNPEWVTVVDTSWPHPSAPEPGILDEPGGVADESSAGLAVAALADTGFRAGLATAAARLEAADVVDIAPTPSGLGFWALAGDGRVRAFGDAEWLGEVTASDASATAIESTPSGLGYWVASASGTIVAFGDAEDHGSLATDESPGRVVDLAATSEHGYLVLTADGTITAFGDADDPGDVGDLEPVRPVEAVLMQASPTGAWVLDRDGRVYELGSRTSFSGATSGGPACRWDDVIGAVASDDGEGLRVIADGLQVWSFGTARGQSPLRLGRVRKPETEE